MDPTQIKFLLDENIPVKLKSVFKNKGLDCTPIQELGWSGVKDNEVYKHISGKNIVLVTRDKDFTFLWKKWKLRIIYIAIEPAILNAIQPKIHDLLENWKYDSTNPKPMVTSI